LEAYVCQNNGVSPGASVDTLEAAVNTLHVDLNAGTCVDNSIVLENEFALHLEEGWQIQGQDCPFGCFDECRKV